MKTSLRELGGFSLHSRHGGGTDQRDLGRPLPLCDELAQASLLCFFKKALKSLEAIEPHVKFVAEQQHIDYHFTGLEDEHDDGDEDDIYDEQDDGELSFDYGQNDREQDVPISRNSMELDAVDITFPQTSTLEVAKVTCIPLQINHWCRKLQLHCQHLLKSWLACSFSIPSCDLKAMASEKVENVPSPPLAPISLSNMQSS